MPMGNYVHGKWNVVVSDEFDNLARHDIVGSLRKEDMGQGLRQMCSIGVTLTKKMRQIQRLLDMSRELRSTPLKA